MEAITTPPSNQTKSASRLAQMANNPETHDEILHFQVEYAPSPSPPLRRRTPLSTPSKLSINKPRGQGVCLPMHELLLNLSPSPVRKSSRARLSDRLDAVDECCDHRRKCKSRTSANGLPGGCGSPRNARRSRRRLEAEDRDFVAVDELNKPRKRRTSGKSKKEKPSSCPVSSPKERNEDECSLDRVGLMIWDLVMWRDVAKSSLWFGFGCLCVLSSCFTKGLSISLFSVSSQLGLLFLAASFLSNTLHQREHVQLCRETRLKEEDILRVIRVILPALNLAIAKTRQLFSGEPSMTLKVALFLLVGAEYGHLLTLRRLCALGFFTSFTGPKLYSKYAAQIDSKVEQYKSSLLDAWKACHHKKAVAIAAATVFWNLSSLKTRVFSAFISLVILRYHRQHSDSNLDVEQDSIPRHENMKLKGQSPDTEDKVKEQPAVEVADKNSDE